MVVIESYRRVAEEEGVFGMLPDPEAGDLQGERREAAG